MGDGEAKCIHVVGSGCGGTPRNTSGVEGFEGKHRRETSSGWGRDFVSDGERVTVVFDIERRSEMG